MSGNGKRALKPVQPKQSLSEKMAKFKRDRDSLGVDWSQVEQADLKGAIASVINAGAAVMFSQASGGRGVIMTLFDDGEKVKLYAIDAEELAERLGEIIDAFGSGSEDVRLAVV